VITDVWLTDGRNLSGTIVETGGKMIVLRCEGTVPGPGEDELTQVTTVWQINPRHVIAMGTNVDPAAE
jgi:hypothetical protein